MCCPQSEVLSAGFHSFHHHIFPAQPPGPLSPGSFSASFLLIEHRVVGGGEEQLGRKKPNTFFFHF